MNYAGSFVAQQNIRPLSASEEAAHEASAARNPPMMNEAQQVRLLLLLK